MHPRKLIRDSVGFAATQYVARAALMLRGVIAARLLGPGPYGAWNALNLILDYGPFSLLGTQQGLDQAVPARIVDGDHARLMQLARAGLFNIVTTSAVFASAIMLYVARSSGSIRTHWGLDGVAVALCCVVLINFAYYHLTLQRSHGDIGSVSVWFVLQGAIGAILGLSLVPWLGAWGLLWGWLVANAVALAYSRWRSPPSIPIVPRASRDSLLLLRVGFPMFLYQGLSLIMRSVDRIMVLRFVGVEGLGFYSLGLMALTLVLYLPDSVSYVLYPHFLRRYREGGDRPEAIREDALRSLRVLTVTIAGLCGLTFLGAREAVAMLLPKFIPGAGVVRVLCFGAAGLTMANLSSILLMTLGRRMHLVVAAVFMTAAGAALDFAALRAGYGINGVAWATFTTYAVNGAVLLWLACGALRLPLGRRVLEMVWAYLPLVVSLVLAVALDAALPGRQAASFAVRAGRIGLGAACFVVLYGAAVHPLMRGLGLRQVIREFRLPFVENGQRPPDAES
jgi:O-antigen/teichoic acid export membrane protein